MFCDKNSYKPEQNYIWATAAQIIFFFTAECHWLNTQEIIIHKANK